jgi:hypothetical protein
MEASCGAARLDGGLEKAPAAFSERSRSYQPCGGFGEAPSPSDISAAYSKPWVRSQWGTQTSGGDTKSGGGEGGGEAAERRDNLEDDAASDPSPCASV